MKTNIQLLSFIILTASLVNSCASRGYPEGGLKDIAPPQVVRSTPDHNGVGFKGKEVTIRFDELIKIDGMDEKFVSSPPLKKRPTIVVRGKNLEIRLDEDLQPNATYTFDFADAISDINEGNKLKDYRFSFSTGTQIDSFAISGNLYDSKSLAPISGALVLLYKNLNDTAFTSEVPLRLGKTDKSGFFSIHNIGQGNYRIFGLNDANRNYIFDQPGEEIAWDKNVFSPSIEYQTVRDSSALKNLAPKDSVSLDTLKTKKVKVNLPNNLQLFMYQQDYVVQYVTNANRKERSKIDLCFSRPLNGDIDLRLQKDPQRTANSWAIRQNSINRDTITYWLTDTLVSNIDSLALTLKFNTTDSLFKPIAKVDSFVTYFFEMPVKKKKLKKGEVIKLPTLEMNNLSSEIDIYQPYSINLQSPAVQYNAAGVRLFEQRDSVATQIDFELVKDTIVPTRFLVKKKWEYKVSYFVTIDSATFTNSYGLVNVGIKKKFDIKPESSYGLLFFTLSNATENALVQLVDANDGVIRQQYSPKNGKMAFQLLRPGDYFIRIVDDANRNKKLDIGDYKRGIMPEKIIYYPEKLSIRANWRHDVKWDAATFDLYKFVKEFRKEPKKRKE